MSSESKQVTVERNAEAALGRLAGSWDPLAPGAVDAEESDVVAWIESLALLAYGVAPESPSAATRARLLQQVAAEPRAPHRAPPAVEPKPVQTVVAAGGASLVDTGSAVDMTLYRAPRAASSGDTDPGDLTLVGRRADLTGGELGATMRREPEAPQRSPRHSRRPSLLPWALAAALVGCLVALGFLYGQLQAQRGRSVAEQARLESELQQAFDDLGALRKHLQMVTEVARTAYPMRQAIGDAGVRAVAGRPDPSDGLPDGIVYVCGHHQQWYLSLTGLQAPPAGKAYHVWFVTEQGNVDGGALTIDAEGRADVQQPSMPRGTRGFVVTLEDSLEAIDSPAGPVILRGEKPVKL